MTPYRAAVLTVLLTLLPATLAAQVRFSVGGFGGAFFPTGDLIDEGSGNDVKSFKLNTGWTAGGRAAVWLTPRLAVEAEAAYAGSDIEILNREGGVVLADTTLSANMFYGSVNVMYLVVDPPFDPISVYLAAGLGFVDRSGDGFDFFESTGDIAGTLGLGIRYGVARNVLIRADLRDYISAFKDDRLQTESKLQNDLLVSAGVEVMLGGG